MISHLLIRIERALHCHIVIWDVTFEFGSEMFYIPPIIVSINKTKKIHEKMKQNFDLNKKLLTVSLALFLYSKILLDTESLWHSDILAP